MPKPPLIFRGHTFVFRGVNGMIIPSYIRIVINHDIRIPINQPSKVVSTHLWNTPLNLLPTGYNGIPFIVGQGDCLGCALGVCCNFLGNQDSMESRAGALFGSWLNWVCFTEVSRLHHPCVGAEDQHPQ